MSIESVIALIREKNELQEKLEKEGCPYPVAESFKVYGHKIHKEIGDTLEITRKFRKKESDTKRVAEWRITHRAKFLAQKKRAYLRKKQLKTAKNIKK